MNNKLKNSNMDFLFDAVLTLRTREECYNFFEDLCTVPEMKALSQRIVVAKMLTEHKVYSDIVGETGASTATISRVNRSLIYGSDGYSVAFERLIEKEAAGPAPNVAESAEKEPSDGSYPTGE